MPAVAVAVGTAVGKAVAVGTGVEELTRVGVGVGLAPWETRTIGIRAGRSASVTELDFSGAGSVGKRTRSELGHAHVPTPTARRATRERVRPRIVCFVLSLIT